MRSICLVVMLSLVLPILSLGAVLNVPTDYATAAEALEWVQEGDTVLLEPGTYSGLGFQDIEYSGPNCWIIGGDEPENTIIDLKGGYFVHVYASAQWEWPVVGIETATFTNGRQAIDLGEYSTTNIRDCIFFQNEVALTDSVWFSSGSIVSCRFVDNDTAYLLGGESYESFYDCVFESNTVAVHSVGGLNADFLNCVFVGNILAFSLDFNSFLSIANSCISHNLIGIRDYSYDADLYLECNNVFGNDIDYYGCPDQTGINGNISRDPLFCDTTFSTLSVASISPLLPEHNDCGVNIGNVSIGCYCGDINASGQRDISDLTFLVSYMFDGGLPPDPSWAGDVDGSGGTDISDVTYYVDYLFNSGPDPEC